MIEGLRWREGAQLDSFILAQLGMVLANQSQNVDTLGDKDNSDDKVSIEEPVQETELEINQATHLRLFF